MSKSQIATINWRKKFLPFKAKASLEDLVGELTLTEKALIFSPAQGLAIGADVDLIRAMRPVTYNLAVTYSTGGEMKTLEFRFPEDTDGKDSFRFARRILGLQPTIGVTGFRTLSNEEFQKLALEAMKIIPSKTEFGDDEQLQKDQLLNQLWAEETFLSWPQIIWYTIISYHYYVTYIENREEEAGWEHNVDGARKHLETVKNDLARVGLSFPPPPLSSFPLV